MIQEHKQLLLKDLCARLPYGVKCRFISSKGDIPSTIVNIDIDNETVSHKPEGQSLIYFHFVESGNIKPYLRSMSSMTEEERKEHDFYCGYKPHDENIGESYLTEYDMPDYMDWLLEHHLDYRGLIPMGLALEAPEEMYKTE
ncbi:MAG: hypothetical protein J6T10_13035 [Methanobrevibacter sp.]|nr:hypothetical protein [Methanobrevibacter sp.]